MRKVSPVTGQEGYPGTDWQKTSGYASQAYYENFDAWHTGHDLARYQCQGQPIYAVADGLIKYANNAGDTGFGKLVFIKHDDNLFTRYAHLDAIHVHYNETVQAGQIIGLLGSTGRSTGPHLHFDVMTRSNALDWPGKDHNRVLTQYINPHAWYADNNGPSVMDSEIEKMRVIATIGLNVRQTPAIRGTRLYALEYDSLIDVKSVGISANDLVWRELRSGGWVAEKFLEPVSLNGG